MQFHRGAPVAIMAFNRPDYLDVVLASLQNQTDRVLKDEQVHLFQDGAVNPVSGRRSAADLEISESVEVFKKYFPSGTVHASSTNLGVARNFARAENLFFNTLEAPIAYFFEDDLELGPYYLKTLETLGEAALQNEAVGYVAAYGTPRNDEEAHAQQANKLTPLGHNWAFGLTRRQWLRSQPYVKQYLKLVENIDYRDRDIKAIYELFKSWGMGVPGTSQDVAKSLACFLTGGVKVNTNTAYGRYIGERGLHMNPQKFDAMGHRGSVFANQDLHTKTDISEGEIIFLRKHLANYCKEEIKV